MREIKFRAYIKNLGWIVPVGRINFDVETIEVDLTDGQGDMYEYNFDEVRLMQYTGYKDDNGNEIYEGDKTLLTVEYEEDGEEVVDCATGIVNWNEGGYIVKCEEGRYDDETLHDWMFESVVVIGNIYENKELLEEKQ